MLSRRFFVKGLGGAALVSLSGAALRARDQLEMHLKVAKAAKKSVGFSRAHVVVFYPKGCLGNLKPIKSLFEELTGIEVDLKEASLDEISSEMILAKRLKSEASRYDVALPPTFALPDLIEAGVIANLSEFAKEYEPKNFRESYLYAVGDAFLGQLYGYQTDGDAYLLFLRKSWLEQSEHKEGYKSRFSKSLGVPITWGELDRQIEFFYNPKSKKFGGSLFRNKSYILWEYWIRLHAKKVYPFLKNMGPNIASPEAIEALNEMIAVSAYLDPNTQKDGLFDNFKHFAKGGSYCNLGWGGTQKYLSGPESQIKDDLLFSAAPGCNFDGQDHNLPFFNWGWNYVVSQESQIKQLAYLFCLFASTPYVSTLAVRETSGFFDPFRKEHYQDNVIEKTYGRAFLNAHALSMENAIPDLYLRGQGRYLFALKQALYLAHRGQVPPHLALGAVSKKWEEITNELGRKKQMRQWHDLVKLYPKIVAQNLSL